MGETVEIDAWIVKAAKIVGALTVLGGAGYSLFAFYDKADKDHAALPVIEERVAHVEAEAQKQRERNLKEDVYWEQARIQKQAEIEAAQEFYEANAPAEIRTRDVQRRIRARSLGSAP